MERVSSKKYLQLKSDEASLLDLIRILFSGNLESKQFIECLRVKEIAFERRGYIFLSVSVQKALHFISRPLSFLGSISELCLNLLASYQSLPTLLLRILQGYSSLIFLFDISNCDLVLFSDFTVIVGKLKLIRITVGRKCRDARQRVSQLSLGYWIYRHKSELS